MIEMMNIMSSQIFTWFQSLLMAKNGRALSISFRRRNSTTKKLRKRFSTVLLQGYHFLKRIVIFRDAFEVARYLDHGKRIDWENIKNQVMWKALVAKFSQHEVLKQLLLSTGNRTLIEDSPHDSYWGIGNDGKGLNMLGKMLEAVWFFFPDLKS